MPHRLHRERGDAAEVAAAAASFPEPIDGEVSFCGFTSEQTYGGVELPDRAAGGPRRNVLVDSPRFAEPLVRRLRDLGGVRLMVLTHRDDVGDHAAFARAFGCPRVMHAADGAARLGVERVLAGADVQHLDDGPPRDPDAGAHAGPRGAAAPGAVPVHGRSPGVVAGGRGAATRSREVCWYSWAEQGASMARLLDQRFEWVLPGHGRIHHAPADVMRARLAECVEWMQAGDRAR